MSNNLLSSNLATTTLAGAISNVATSLSVQSGAGALFPNPGVGQYFVACLVDAATGLLFEVVWVTARSTDTFTIVRGEENTTGLNWNAGDFISNLWTAGQFEQTFGGVNYAGNPNGNVAGAAASGINPPTLCWDTTDGALWICTGSGVAAAAVWTSFQTHSPLGASTTFYVNASTGNDTNTGLSPGASWQHLQYARNYVQAHYDLQGNTVTFNCTGAFTLGVTIQYPLTGQIGAEIWNFATGSSIITTNGTQAFFVLSGASAILQGAGAFSIGATGGSGLASGILAQSGGIITLGAGPLTFLTCSQAHIAAGAAGVVNLAHSYTVTQGATEHYAVSQGSVIATATGVPITVTVSSTPAFSTAFCTSVNLGTFQANATITFSGTATGNRYLANVNGIINTNGGGANYFPGSIAGSTSTGGQYV